MAARMRDTNWINDKHLEDTLQKLFGDNLKRTEIFDYVQRGFPEYTWSLYTLDRRARFFSIFKTDKNVSVEEVQRVFVEEISGPGYLFGYHVIHIKIRQHRHFNVPRSLVYAAMEGVDPNGLEYRTIREKKTKEKKEVLHLKGTVGYFPLMVLISSWASITVLSRLQYLAF